MAVPYLLPLHSTAIKTKAACSLDPVRGDCFEVIPRWYFNPRTGSCRRFSYSGCGGNDNNFQTQEECHGICMSKKSTTTATTENEVEEGRQHGKRGQQQQQHHKVRHEKHHKGHRSQEDAQVVKGTFIWSLLKTILFFTRLHATTRVGLSVSRYIRPSAGSFEMVNNSKQHRKQNKTNDQHGSQSLSLFGYDDDVCQSA